MISPALSETGGAMDSESPATRSDSTNLNRPIKDVCGGSGHGRRAVSGHRDGQPTAWQADAYRTTCWHVAQSDGGGRRGGRSGAAGLGPTATTLEDVTAHLTGCSVFRGSGFFQDSAKLHVGLRWKKRMGREQGAQTQSIIIGESIKEDEVWVASPHAGDMYRGAVDGQRVIDHG